MNDKKALLIIPSKRHVKDTQQIGNIYAPISLAYIAAYSESKGVEVKVVDCNAENLGMDQLLRIVRDFGPTVIGFPLFTEEFFDVADMVQKVKGILPSVKTVVGGPHASALPERTVREMGGLDFVVIGEGEIPFYNIIRYAAGEMKREDIDGIAYKCGDKGNKGNKNKVIITKPQKYVDPDTLPFPAWDLFPLDKYFGRFIANSYRGGRNELELPVISTRGCPYRCIFCYKTTKEVRYRKPRSVVDEIERNLREFGSRRVYLCEGTFGLPRARCVKVCDEIIERGLHRELTWCTTSRVDIVDRKFLLKMVEAGLTDLCVGVESGSQMILDASKKGITVDQIRNKFKMINKIRDEYGIETEATYVIGLPYETKETLSDTLDIVKEIKTDRVSFSILVPFPGTEVEKMARKGEGGLIFKDARWDEYGKQIGQSIALEQLSATDLKKFQMEAYREAYIRNKKFRNLIDMLGWKRFFKLGIRNIPYLVKSKK